MQWNEAGDDMKTYQLCLDESGKFEEGERDGDVPFASQLVGFFGPAGHVTEKRAEALLRAATGANGSTLEKLLHATELGRGERYDTLATEVANGVVELGWQPVRFENRERLAEDSISNTYVTLVAELCARIFERLAPSVSGEQVTLRLFAARYMVKGGVQIERNRYLSAVRSRLGDVSARRGHAATSALWQVEGVELGSGRTDRRLQICDVLSNASHDGYYRLGESAKRTVRSAFGEYDVSVASVDVERRARAAAEEGAVGLALRAVGEELVADRLMDEPRRRLSSLRAKLLEQLGMLPAASRRIQLRALEDWLHSVAEERRDSVLAKQLIQWIQKDVMKPLQKWVPERDPALAAHRLVVHRYDLTAANHAGEPKTAREACKAIDDAVHELGGRWEHAEPILDALTHQAVHLTDCFEHEVASRRARLVADYYGELGSLFNTLLPEVFPEEVGSDQRARALGTAMQAEMYRGLREPEAFAKARALSEAALAEFDAPHDVAQQHQYRAQLETYAGDFDCALAHLATALGVDPSHTAIADEVNRLTGIPQGFGALHWARLVAHMLENPSGDLEELGAAVDRAKLDALDWVTDDDKPYPAHGLRRHLARIQAARGERKKAETTLVHLRQLREHKRKEQPLLTLIDAAAHAQVISSLLREHRKAAHDVIGKAPVGKLQRLASTYKGEMPELAAAAEAMAVAFKRAEDDPWDHVAARLSKAAARIGY